MKKRILNYLMGLGLILVIALAFALSGCTEAQKITGPNEPPVWGKGELSPKWVEMFGNDNPSRLNKVQNNLISKHETHLYGADQVVDGKETHAFGLIDLVVNLQKRVEALGAVEIVDPNRVEIVENNTAHINSRVSLLEKDGYAAIEKLMARVKVVEKWMYTHNVNEWRPETKSEPIEKFTEGYPTDAGPNYWREEMRKDRAKINEIIDRLNE